MCLVLWGVGERRLRDCHPLRRVPRGGGLGRAWLPPAPAMALFLPHPYPFDCKSSSPLPSICNQRKTQYCFHRCLPTERLFLPDPEREERPGHRSVGPERTVRPLNPQTSGASRGPERRGGARLEAGSRPTVDLVHMRVFRLNDSSDCAPAGRPLPPSSPPFLPSPHAQCSSPPHPPPTAKENSLTDPSPEPRGHPRGAPSCLV